MHGSLDRDALLTARGHDLLERILRARAEAPLTPDGSV